MDLESPEACERIVESRVLFIPPPDEHWEGAEIKVVVALGRPQGEHPGFCTVFLDGYRKPIKIGGMDKFHALCCAMKFLRNIMQRLQDRGWRFTSWFDEDVVAQADTAEQEVEEELEGETHFSVDEFFAGL